MFARRPTRSFTHPIYIYVFVFGRGKGEINISDDEFDGILSETSDNPSNLYNHPRIFQTGEMRKKD